MGCGCGYSMADCALLHTRERSLLPNPCLRCKLTSNWACSSLVCKSPYLLPSLLSLITAVQKKQLITSAMLPSSSREDASPVIIIKPAAFVTGVLINKDKCKSSNYPGRSLRPAATLKRPGKSSRSPLALS